MPTCPITNAFLGNTLAFLPRADENPYTYWDRDDKYELTSAYSQSDDVLPSLSVLQLRSVYLCGLVLSHLQPLVTTTKDLSDAETLSVETAIERGVVVDILQHESNRHVLLLTRFNLSGDQQRKTFQAQQGLAIASARELPAKLDSGIVVFDRARAVLLDPHLDAAAFACVGEAAATFFHELQIPYKRRIAYAQELLKIVEEPSFPWRKTNLRWWTSLEGYAGS